MCGVLLSIIPKLELASIGQNLKVADFLTLLRFRHQCLLKVVILLHRCLMCGALFCIVPKLEFASIGQNLKVADFLTLPRFRNQCLLRVVILQHRCLIYTVLFLYKITFYIYGSKFKICFIDICGYLR
jgi:hypothetical protein